MSARQNTVVSPRVPDNQGVFCLTTLPNGHDYLMGKALAYPLTNPSGAGTVSGAGTYEAEVLTDGWSTLEVAIRASAVTGSILCFLRTKWADGTTRLEAAATALVPGTPQVLTLTNLRGQRKAALIFTLGATDSVTFDRAEFNGL